MDKVYLVSHGEYSDYKIDAAFSSPDKAQEFASKRNARSRYDGEYDVEEYPLDPPDDFYPTLRVAMKKDGGVEGLTTGFNEAIGFWLFHWEFDDPNRLRESKSFSWTVATDNEERAVKVVNEKRAQILARNLWGNDEGVEQLFRGEPGG